MAIDGHIPCIFAKHLRPNLTSFIVLGYTADGWPHCGQVPGRENQYILAGYNGAGMPLIFLTARGIAKMIREDVPFESTSIPRIFKTTEERLKKDVAS